MIVPEGTAGSKYNEVSGRWSIKVGTEQEELTNYIMANQNKQTKATSNFVKKLANIYKKNQSIEDKKENSKANTYAIAKDETSNSGGSSSGESWLAKIYNILYPHK